MNTCNLGVCTLIVALTFAGCATQKAEASVLPPDGKVEGILTINGKTFPLKYVYTGRKKPRLLAADTRIEWLLTNEPIAYETLSKILLEMSLAVNLRRESQLLKGTSLKALYLTEVEPAYKRGDGAQKGEMLCDEAILMSADGFFRYNLQGGSVVQFEEVTVNNGMLSAKAKYNWQQSAYTEDDKEIQITANYAIRFAARMRDESLLTRSLAKENQDWQTALAALPQEGAAKGKVTLHDQTISLHHAYAMKQKLERLGEVVTILLTDEPVPNEYLLFSFTRRATPVEISGLFLHLDKSGNLHDCVMRYLNGQQPFDDITIKSFKIENGRAIGIAEGIWKSRFSDAPATYSVSFDAPLKE